VNREREYQVSFVRVMLPFTNPENKKFTITSGTPADAAIRMVHDHHHEGPDDDHVLVDVAHNDDPVLRYEVISTTTYAARPVSPAAIIPTRR
jgi:hypothetical protein